MTLSSDCAEEIASAIKDTDQRVIVAAGMSRSGSTWQFNALRLLLESSGESVYSFWIDDWDSEKARPARILLVKIHQISPALAQAAWCCFTCHRDLRDVAMSSADLAQADGYEVDVVALTREIREAHEFWARQSALDAPYARIVTDPESVLERMAAWLGIPITEVEAQRLCQTLTALSDGDVPPGNSHNPLTLLHQQHFFDGRPGRYRGALDDAVEQRIREENGAWLSEHGYLRTKRARWRSLRAVGKRQ
jgi:hypothetical protein